MSDAAGEPQGGKNRDKTFEKRSRARAGLLTIVASLNLLGCSDAPAPLSVEMTFKATNTADHILVVEGRTNLPAGSPLKAELRTREGVVMLRDTAVVRHETFFFDFNLKNLNGLSLYEVNVTFDPETAPLGVRRVTGLWGQALEGPGVSQLNSRRIVQRELDVILSSSVKGKSWEGRDFATMDVSERARLTNELEKEVETEEQDRGAKLALARAYIAANPRELSSGTRAHMLLKQVTGAPQQDTLTTTAQGLLTQIEAQEKKVEELKEKREKIARGDRFRTETQITPGRSVGAFSLGSSFRLLQRHLKLSSPPDFSDPDRPVVVRPTNFPGIELIFNPLSRKIQSVRTTSSNYKLPEGFGIGSLLQELQTAYGMEAVPTPKYTFLKTREDGYALYEGRITAEGLEIEIRREVNPNFALPVDRVYAITVFSSR